MVELHEVLLTPGSKGHRNGETKSNAEENDGTNNVP
jgi:hypothetical protein